MASKVTLYWPDPVEMVDGKLKLHQPINSSVLRRSIEEFNVGRFDTVAVLLKGIRKPEAQVCQQDGGRVMAIRSLGYEVSFHTHMFWTAFLISGILNGTILKSVGIRACRRYVPFFLGLILGDFVIGNAWNILSIILNRPTYTFYNLVIIRPGRDWELLDQNVTY
jgi:hypothetical protein